MRDTILIILVLGAVMFVFAGIMTALKLFSGLIGIAWEMIREEKDEAN
jgi:hypothetical protein